MDGIEALLLAFESRGKNIKTLQKLRKVLDSFYAFILKIAVADAALELGHGLVFKAIK
jgi:hypothetical protein